MNNPFKSKDGEKQSVIRLTVIAGRTFMTGTIITVVWWTQTDQEPKHPEAFLFAAGGGFILYLAGIIASKLGDMDPKRSGQKPIVGWEEIVGMIILIGFLIFLCIPTVR